MDALTKTKHIQNIKVVKPKYFEVRSYIYIDIVFLITSVLT